MKPILWAETARAEYLDILNRIRTDNPAAARRVEKRIDETINSLAHRNIRRRGRVEGTFEKSVVGLPYIVAFALDTEVDGSERLVVLRIFTRHVIGRPAAGLETECASRFRVPPTRPTQAAALRSPQGARTAHWKLTYYLASCSPRSLTSQRS